MELVIEQYKGNQKIYHCGRSLIKTPQNNNNVKTHALVVDYNDCAFGCIYDNGRVEIIFSEHSYVPGKKRAGGQSAKRYEKNRELAIITWFKKINKMLMSQNDVNIILGISPIYKNKFMKYLHTYNKEKIVKITNTEYSDENGIYQLAKKV